MSRKERTIKEVLMTVISLFEIAGITYWIDGGWGVDILAGRQTRDHRDMDIDFDSQHTENLFLLRHRRVISVLKMKLLTGER